MGFLENIVLALNGLRSSKMRALLTMLGIIIGIGSVIAIVTVGNSMTAAVTDQMSSFGIRNIQVSLYSKDGNWGFTDTDMFTIDQIEAFTERFAGAIDAYTVTDSAGRGTARDGRRYSNVSVSGVNDGYAVSQDVDIQRGRFINARDTKGAKNVAVVSDRLVGAMFPPGTDPIGQEVKTDIRGNIHTFAIIGVYKFEVNAFSFYTGEEKDRPTDMYIPVTASQRINGGWNFGFMNFTVTASEHADPMLLGMEIEEYFGREYSKNPRAGVSTFAMESMLEQVTTMMGTLSVAIAIIAAISLLVGGIGVMNIMLVSVTERTREIGTRKALGARNSAIRIQFIVESMIICLIGGVIGIILGLIMGNIGTMLLDFPASASPEIIVIAVLFSMVIGIFFGYYPANKAAKLDPIEALRYE